MRVDHGEWGESAPPKTAYVMLLLGVSLFWPVRLGGVLSISTRGSPRDVRQTSTRPAGTGLE